MAELSLQVSLPPAPSSIVEYYNALRRSILITNVSSKAILLETVELLFQSDFGVATIPVTGHCGTRLEPGASYEHVVVIIPTASFLLNTNTFKIKLRYRFIDEVVDDPRHEVFPQLPNAYIVIREPATHIGKMFISLKQPEDLDLGRLLAKLARRAGLEPFLKADNDRIAEDIWRETIEPALRASDVVAVIWTDQTHWNADGVLREIDLCRELGIREALFLSEDTTKPDRYKGTTVEYKVFSPESPTKAFAQAIESLRQSIVGRRS